jgi:hypothetical protein
MATRPKKTGRAVTSTSKVGTRSKQSAASRPSKASAKVTTDHEEIRRWAEERGGRPATVRGTAGADSGVLRIDFSGGAESSLEEISWGEFFETFDENKLAFLHQERTARGGESPFNKVVSRDAPTPKEALKTRAAGGSREE